MNNEPQSAMSQLDTMMPATAAPAAMRSAYPVASTNTSSTTTCFNASVYALIMV